VPSQEAGADQGISVSLGRYDIHPDSMKQQVIPTKSAKATFILLEEYDIILLHWNLLPI
jgi:hypothetical protein